MSFPSPRAGAGRAPLLATGLACLAALIVSGSLPGAAVPAAAAAQQPNVVVLMTDDQTVADLRGMPRTRRLIARRGVRFRNSFVSYPVCCPSRATYLSGQYPHNHGVLGLYPPTGGYINFDKDNSLPVWMTAAGYHSAHIGKYLNGYGTQTPADVPPGWSEWYGAVDPTTYRMWGYTLNENGLMRTYGSPFVQDPSLYQTDVYRDKAVDFINRRSGKNPFFLSVGFLAPHHEEFGIRSVTGRSVRPAPRHVNARAGAPLPFPPSFDEVDLRDKPLFQRRRSPRLTPEVVVQMTANYRARQESLIAVDEAVRSIVGALKDNGVLDNTYIILTSDNGFLQGEHRVPSGKLLPYDPSTRVPLVISGPGIPRSKATSELVTNEDLAPTILDLAGGRAGKAVDGRSLLPFAEDPKRLTGRLLLNETGGMKAVMVEEDAGPVPQLRRVLTYKAVRTYRYQYIRYRNGDRELYDLELDPDQLHSRHNDPRYRRTRFALFRELRRLARCRGRACRVWGRAIPPPRGRGIPSPLPDARPTRLTRRERLARRRELRERRSERGRRRRQAARRAR